MLSWNKISHHFGYTQVLEDLTHSISAGSCSAIVGPSGCGKSTLLSIAGGLLQPGSGSIENSFERTAMVFQEDRTLPWLNALDNIAFGLKAQGVAKKVRREKASDIAKTLKLTADDLQKYPHQLSGGMRQRVALGRALAIEPNLLLLDEPFSALDIGLKQELQSYVLQKMSQTNLAVVFITHDLLEAIRMCNSILVLCPGGKLVYQCDIPHTPSSRSERFIYHQVASLLEQPAVRAAFDLSHTPPREILSA